MTCPHCHTEITTVYIYATCHQKAWITTEGTIIKRAQPELEDTTDIACSHCLTSLKEMIHE